MGDSTGAGATPGRRPRAVRAWRRRLSLPGVVGLVLVVAGLVVLAWVGFQYLGTGLVSERAFDAGRQQLRQRWEAPAPSPAGPLSGAQPLPGEVTALLRIPAFGPDYEIPVLEGTEAAILAKGVGRYPGTSEPGQVGNFALAGHRVTHGQPFRRLLELDPGDEVVVETRTAVHTYVLDVAPRDLTVDDAATWVLDPVPGEPGREPSRALITLTTCQDLLRSSDRSVGFGYLRSTRNK